MAIYARIFGAIDVKKTFDQDDLKMIGSSFAALQKVRSDLNILHVS